MNVGEARDVNTVLLWATEGNRRGGTGWHVSADEAALSASRLAERTYKTLMHTGQGCGMRGSDIYGLRRGSAVQPVEHRPAETVDANRRLGERETEASAFVNELLLNAPGEWDGGQPAQAIAVAYVRKLEAVANHYLGRLPSPGEPS